MLIGVMQNMSAKQGLSASWGGFRASVDREISLQFFRVRLGDRDALISELPALYNRLDEGVRPKLPLRHMNGCPPGRIGLSRTARIMKKGSESPGHPVQSRPAAACRVGKTPDSAVRLADKKGRRVQDPPPGHQFSCRIRVDSTGRLASP